jgi:hypothetical protein
MMIAVNNILMEKWNCLETISLYEITEAFCFIPGLDKTRK